MAEWERGAHLSDDRVVCGGDSVEDALYAPQGLLAPRGDAVKGFVVVFQGPTTLTVGRADKTCKVRGKKITYFLCYVFLDFWSLIQKPNT